MTRPRKITMRIADLDRMEENLNRMERETRIEHNIRAWLSEAPLPQIEATLRSLIYAMQIRNIDGWERVARGLADVTEQRLRQQEASHGSPA